MLFTQTYQQAHKLLQITRLSVQRPIDPGQAAVVAVGIVVAQLSAAHLIAGEQHRDALR